MGDHIRYTTGGLRLHRDHRHGGPDVYRVTHRSGNYIDLYAAGIFDARRAAAQHKGWKQKDMHVRIVQICAYATERRHTGLTLWLSNALPFYLWR